MFYTNSVDPSSYAEVPVWLIRQACTNYVKAATDEATIVREDMIKAEMTGWFRAKTREKAIKRLDKDNWNWQWTYYREDSIKYKLNNRVKGLLALCELSTNGKVSITEKDAKLVSTYKGK